MGNEHTRFVRAAAYAVSFCAATFSLLVGGCAESKREQVTTVTISQPVTVTVTSTAGPATSSGTDTPPRQSEPQPDDLAEAATVDLADFPAGWRPMSDTTAEELKGTGSCGNQSEMELAGWESPWFETTDAYWVFKSWAWVYDAAETAERLFQAHTDGGFPSCLAGSLVPDPGSGWEFNRRVDGALSFDPVPAADDQAAYEIELTGSDRLLIDLILLRIDRVLVVVALWGDGDSVPRDLHHRLAVAVAERASRTA